MKKSHCWSLEIRQILENSFRENRGPPPKHGRFLNCNLFLVPKTNTGNWKWLIDFRFLRICQYFGCFSFFSIPSRMYSFYFCIQGCIPRKLIFWSSLVIQPFVPLAGMGDFFAGKWWCALGSWILTSIVSKQNQWKVHRSTSSKCSKKQWAGEAKFFRHLGMEGVMSRCSSK